MILTTLYKGQKYTLLAIVVNDRCLVKDFLSNLDRQSGVQVFSLLKRIGDHGPPINEEKFRHLEGKIYELKTRTGARILSFFSMGQTLILTHGFSKPSKKILKIEISKAADWEKAYREGIRTQKQ